jgi:hypothetical protein
MVSTSALAHGLNKLLAVPEEDRAKDAVSRTPRCASRSTSVGSSSSNDQSSGVDSAGPCDTQSPAPGFCAARDWAAPVFVRNTFLDTAPGIPQSLMGFFQEREVHSCPASGIGAPPGLEIPAETNAKEEVPATVAAAKAAKASFTADLPAGCFGYCSDSLGLPEYDYPVPFGVAADRTPTPKAPVSSFDGFMFRPCSLRTLTSEFSMGGLSGICELSPGQDPKVENVALAGAPQRPPVLAPAPAVNSEAAYLAQMVEKLRAENEMLRASLPTGATKDSIIASPEVCPSPSCPATTMANNPMHPAPTMVAPIFLADSLVPPPPMMQADNCVARDDELTSGSPELPSAGSAGHYAGQCKPCVHFWKTGCRNGTECPFCHLCDENEVKRRQGKKASCRKRAIQGGASRAFSGRC